MQKKVKFPVNFSSLLTASFLVRAVITVDGSIAHPFFGDAHFSDPAVKVVLWAVRTVQLVGEVGTVDDAVANAVTLVQVTHLRNTA